MIGTRIILFVIATATLWLAGCSNQDSPVKAEQKDNSAIAAISDMNLQDIAAVGNVVWGLSTEQAVGTNCWLYYYDNRPQAWVKTGHYGIKIAVASKSTKCYHINDQGQIWWATSTSNGQIPNPPSSSKPSDIGVGKVGTFTVIWVTLSNNQIFKYRLDGNQNPVWIDMTKTLGNRPNYNIGVDPYNGNRAAVANNVSAIYITDNESQWQREINSDRTIWNVAYCNTKIVYINGSYPTCMRTSIWDTWTHQYTENKGCAGELGLCAETTRFWYFPVHLDYAVASGY